MHIKLLISAATIALFAGIGSASAGEEFTTLEGVSAGAMSEEALRAVRGGQGRHLYPSWKSAPRTHPE